ncbi:MAG: isocitrate lyase/phosphoenolpyruvate mutase family protein [Alphaproteobacteria bacterium]|nr:isocitrate lyase/phosphoenolpyruvate mutase family protein [Alphaproteobacteria bacterium]
MTTQAKRAVDFKNLHIKGDPLILVNIWDSGSAQTLQTTGAKAIGTSSWSVAAAHGYEDGEKLSLDLVLANLKRILAYVDLPVTLDLEGGYGQSPQKIQETVKKVIEAGAVGINFEDQIVGHEGLYSIDDQCARIKAIREVVDPLFINARTDLFLKADPAHHDECLVEEALNRANAYATAGANGFFAPGLQNLKLIEKLCALSPLPVNIMLLSDTPSSKQLAELGVARISYGPYPYFQAMDALKAIGRKAFAEI